MTRLSRLDTANFRGVLDLVLDELREQIVSGEISPGQVLRQRELAAELGVSREPIKQAMRVLEAEGLIVSPPRRSAFVAPITRKVVQDIYEVRAALDSVVAGRAAQLDEDCRRHVADELDVMIDEADGRRQPKTRRLVELDANFHMKIYEAADNDVATAFFRARWIVIGRSMSLVASTEYWRRAWREHHRIAEAIRAGAAEEAAALAGSHAHDAAAWLVAHAIRTDETVTAAPE